MIKANVETKKEIWNKPTTSGFKHQKLMEKVDTASL